MNCKSQDKNGHKVLRE